MLEKYLIEHCAPTLASLKTASLFCIAVKTEEELESQLKAWNGQLQEKGLFLLVLRRNGGEGANLRVPKLSLAGGPAKTWGCGISR